jgi:hypothetical protein
MKVDTVISAEEEPIGIVISRGIAGELRPSVFAYVWSAPPQVAGTSEPPEAAA